MKKKKITIWVEKNTNAFTFLFQTTVLAHSTLFRQKINTFIQFLTNMGTKHKKSVTNSHLFL